MDVDATLREICELTAQANAAYTAGDMDTWAARSAELRVDIERLLAVRKLIRSDRKTVSMAALREALGGE